MRGKVVKGATGIRGVRRATRTYSDGRKPVVVYEVYIKLNGVTTHIGSFASKRTASAVSKEVYKARGLRTANGGLSLEQIQAVVDKLVA